MSSSDTKLDPRVRRTRKLLKSAFIELMMEKGFEAMTVQDIAERAEINRATFYAHFADKYDLHDSMLVEWFQEKLTEYDVSQKASFCGGNLRNLIFAVCDFMKQLNGGCHPAEIQYKPVLEDLVQAEVYSIIYGWLQSVGSIDKPDVVSASVSWAIFGASLQWSKQSTHSKEDIADIVMGLMDSGLRTQVRNLPDLATVS